MKIGIRYSPYVQGHARFGKDRFIKIAKHGFSAVDYNIYDTDIELYKMSDIDAEKKLLADKNDAALANIEISQVHGPWRQPQDSTEELRRERMEKMKRSILFTSILGCKHWVIHPIMPYGIQEKDTKDAEKTWELNIEFMSRLLEYAKEQDIVICLENMPMPQFSIATPAKILEFVKTMNDDHFKICLDTGHVAVFPELSIADEVLRLGDNIKAIHVHDNMGDGDTHLWPTKGIIDWRSFVNSLKKTGFKNAFSLEISIPATLNDDDFEKESIELNKIAKSILENS